MISADYPSRSYGSHLHPLLKCALATSGRVLEIGCGEWSTPVIRAYCLATQREFVSAESRAEWADAINSQLGDVVRLDLSGDIDALAAGPWSVVLVDHDPARERAREAAKFARSAEFVLVHDCELGQIADSLAPLLGLWKFREVYTANGTPHTMILSNTRKLSFGYD
jgi:hypothetical protein